FAAALGYLLVRVALAVLAQRPPVTLDSEPHEVAPDPLPPAEWLPIGEAENGHGHGAPARQWRVSADDAAALEAQGFAVLRADEVRREGHEQALRAWQRAAAGAPPDEEALATFRAR